MHRFHRTGSKNAQDALDQVILELKEHIRYEYRQKPLCEEMARAMLLTQTFFRDAVETMEKIRNDKGVSKELAQVKEKETTTSSSTNPRLRELSIDIAKDRMATKRRLEPENDELQVKRLLKLYKCVIDMADKGDVTGVRQTLNELSKAEELLREMGQLFESDHKKLDELHSKIVDIENKVKNGQLKTKEGQEAIATINKGLEELKAETRNGEEMRTCEEQFKNVFNATYSYWETNFKKQPSQVKKFIKRIQKRTKSVSTNGGRHAE